MNNNIRTELILLYIIREQCNFSIKNNKIYLKMKYQYKFMAVKTYSNSNS